MNAEPGGARDAKRMMVADEAFAWRTGTAPGSMKAPKARAVMKKCLALLMALSYGEGGTLPQSLRLNIGRESLDGDSSSGGFASDQFGGAIADQHAGGVESGNRSPGNH